MDKFYKILRIVFMVVVLISIVSKVFAFDVTYSGVNYSFQDSIITTNYEYWAVFYNTTNLLSGNKYRLYLYGSDQPLRVNISGSNLSVSSPNSTNICVLSSSCTNNATTYATMNQQWNLANFSLTSTNYYNSGGVSIDSFKGDSGSYTLKNSTVTTYNFFYSNHNIYDSNGDLYFSSNVTVNPYIVNEDVEIEDWEFDNLIINLGTYSYDTSDSLRIIYNNNETIVDRDTINFNYNSNNNTISIGQQQISDMLYMVPDSSIQFYYNKYIGAGNIQSFDLGTYNVLITTEVAEDINNNSEQNYQNKVTESLNQLNAIYTQGQEQAHEDSQEIKDAITDDTVESGADDLPNTNVNNPTENGLDNIFTNFYNAFCTGNPQDIVFPIPFTNKEIRLSPNYVKNMLQNNGATWVYTFINAFWGYLIGRFIIKDISKKITKIKSGNVEDIQNTNIKEEML